MVLGKPGTPEFEAFVKSERADWQAGTMHPGIKQMWMQYLLGKPKETIDVQGGLELIKVVRVIVDPQALEGDVH